MSYQLTDRFIVSADLNQTWSFFSNAANLPRITPPWMRFSIQTPGPIVIGQDTLIDYTIRWMGLPIRWRTQIIDWSPQRQFIDLQVRGPYALWHHQHTFTPVEEGVECMDRVTYKVAGPILGTIMHAALVRRQLLEIFGFRRQIVAKDLGWVRAVQPDVLIKRI